MPHSNTLFSWVNLSINSITLAYKYKKDKNKHRLSLLHRVGFIWCNSLPQMLSLVFAALLGLTALFPQKPRPCMQFYELVCIFMSLYAVSFLSSSQARSACFLSVFTHDCCPVCPMLSPGPGPPPTLAQYSARASSPLSGHFESVATFRPRRQHSALWAMTLYKLFESKVVLNVRGTRYFLRGLWYFAQNINPQHSASRG